MTTDPSPPGTSPGTSMPDPCPTRFLARWSHRADALAGGMGRWLLRFGMVWVLAILALTVADILGRDCANRPVPGALELNEAMLAVMGFCGMAATQRAGGNVRVNFLLKRMRGPLGTATRVLALVPGVVVAGLLSWRGIVAAGTQFRAGTVTDALHLPVYPLYVVLALCAAVLTLELGAETLREIFKSGGSAPEKTGETSAP